MGAEAPMTLFILLLVTVLTKPLFALVRCHFMTLALFSAWHSVPRGLRVTKFDYHSTSLFQVASLLKPHAHQLEMLD